MTECANCGRWVATWVTFSARTDTPHTAPPPLTVCKRCFQTALNVFEDLVGADWVEYGPGEAAARASLQASYHPG